MTRTRIHILGSLRVFRDGHEVDAGPRQQRCMLALLAARAGQPISQSEMIDLLWADTPPASAANVIYKYIGALRRLLEPDLPHRAQGVWLVRQGNGYRFVADADQLDLAEFRIRVEAARASARAERAAEALDEYLDGLRLWQGRPGTELADSAAAVAVFAALQGELYEATMEATDLAVSLGQPQRMVAHLRRAAEVERFNEPLHAALIRTLATSGQRAEAVAAFQAVRGRLTGELGLEPGPGLERALHDVLADDPGEAGTAGAEAPVPVRPVQLPPDLPTFVGRDAELAQLRRLLDDRPAAGRTSPLIVSIDGMGGVGKSTLALHFGYSIARLVPDGQLYLDLRGQDAEPVSPERALRSLLPALGVSPVDLPDDRDALTGMYRSLTAHRRLLVLLDNALDVAQIRPLLPNSAGSVVLVTARAPLAGLAAYDGAHLLHVDVPERPEARKMLAERLPAAAGSKLIETVITRCGRLPLALAIVAARISARPEIPPAAVVSELDDDDALLHALRGSPGVVDPRAAFSWSYRQLSPDAARLFRLSSVALCPELSVAACASLAGLDPGAARDLLRELSDVALLTERDSRRYSSHVLVKAYARELCADSETEAERAEAVGRLLQHYLLSSVNARSWLGPPAPPVSVAVLPGVRPEEPGSYDDAMAWFDTEREVLRDAVRRAAETGLGITPWQLTVTAQEHLRRCGFLGQWLEIARLSLEAALRTADRRGEAEMLRSLAGARFCAGSYEQARDLLLRAREVFREIGQAPAVRQTGALIDNILDRIGQVDAVLAVGGRSASQEARISNSRGVGGIE